MGRENTETVSGGAAEAGGCAGSVVDCCVVEGFGSLSVWLLCVVFLLLCVVGWLLCVVWVGFVHRPGEVFVGFVGFLVTVSGFWFFLWWG